MSPIRTRRPLRSRSSGRLAALAWLVLLPACGPEESRIPTHPTTGRILQDGQPVADALVRFHPVDPSIVTAPEGTPPIAPTPIAGTDADGRFSLSSYEADDGVPAGAYKVTVLLGEGIGLGDEAFEDPEAAEAKPAARRARSSASEARYRNPETTPLRADVTEGENSFEFVLE